jgi:hypothetical protein
MLTRSLTFQPVHAFVVIIAVAVVCVQCVAQPHSAALVEGTTARGGRLASLLKQPLI